MNSPRRGDRARRRPARPALRASRAARRRTRLAIQAQVVRRLPRWRPLLLPVLLTLLSACQVPPEELTFLGALPPWRFETEQGRPLADSDLKGRPYIANFLFTACPSSCPPLAQATAALQAKMQAWRQPGGPRIISFSVDPVTDTPEVLRGFARKYGADPKLWSFARADYAATEALVTRGFLQPLLRRDRPPGSPLAAVAERPTPIDTAHTLRFVLVDSAGRMRALYDKDEDSLERLNTAVRWLAEHGDGPVAH